jgi:hypothetical protein
MTFTYRIGCFFLFIGGLIFFLFLATDMVHEPQFTVLVVSLPLLGFGFFLWRKGRPIPRPSGRFGIVTRMRRQKKDPEEKRHGS